MDLREDAHVIWVWVKRWALIAVGVPLVAWLLDTVASSVEQRRGETSATRGMHGVAGKIRDWREGRRGRRGARRR
jgi:hypothetical protein